MREIQISELRDVAKRFEIAANHDAVATWARDFYGDHAETVQIECESEYNDEGGYYLYVTSIVVLDEDGEDITEQWIVMSPARQATLRKQYDENPRIAEYYKSFEAFVAYKKRSSESMREDEPEYAVREEFSEYGFDAGDSNDSENYSVTFKVKEPRGGLPRIFIED